MVRVSADEVGGGGRGAGGGLLCAGQGEKTLTASRV
jgi:hypothetical protein